MSEDKETSQTRAIDRALKKMMAKLDGDEMPPETKVKVITAAISWEKVKHSIKDQEEFDPDSL
jgi:hypothetical protein